MAKSEKSAKQELKDARKNLERVAAKSKDETPAYREANDRVLKAERSLSWWRR